jgi:hypothetical protein
MQNSNIILTLAPARKNDAAPALHHWKKLKYMKKGKIEERK